MARAGPNLDDGLSYGLTVCGLTISGLIICGLNVYELAMYWLNTYWLTMALAALRRTCKGATIRCNRCNASHLS
jgi:hypothetical protein